MNSLTLTLCVLMEAVLIITSNCATREKEWNVNKPYPLSSSYSSSPISKPTYKPVYSYSYNIDTGIQIQEEGYLKHIDTNMEALEVRGSYAYNDNEGNTFHASYIANENGFLLASAHLPTVPSFIIKTLQYIAEHPEENGE